MADPRVGAFRFELEMAEGYVLCRQFGSMRSVDDAKGLQAKMERALERVSHGLVLFDNRLTGEPDVAARESMWAWCRDCKLVLRTALLLESDLTLVRANMTAVGKRSPVRAFNREEDAVAWLLEKRVPRGAK